MPNLIIGSRGSRLALWQANLIKTALERLHPELTIEIEIIKTTGDKLTEASLARIGGKGVFTKEIEDALLEARIDLAVHSLKDLPTTLPEGLHVSAITEREDVRDALIVSSRLASQVSTLTELPVGARVGTSSLRRAAQLRGLRAALQIIELRGNVETRLKKLNQGNYDAIILASAGLVRLGFADQITERIPTTTLLPAVGQGALGIEARVGDGRTNFLIEGLNHWPTRNATQGERALLRGLGGGCAVPIAAYGHLEAVEGENGEGSFTLEALVADPDGHETIYDKIIGSPYRSEGLGELLAERMLAAGAKKILDKVIRPAEPDIHAGTKSEPAGPVASPIEAPGDDPPGPAIAPPIAAAELEPDSSLAGRRIIITRAARQAGELMRQLSSHGGEIIPCPTIEIRDPSDWRSLDRALGRLAEYHWLAFTSTNGVEYFLRRMDELERDRAELSALRICAVGKKTAEKLIDEGLRIDLMPTRFTADSLVEAFIKRYGVDHDLKGSRMLLPASRTTRDVIRPALTDLGVSVDVVEAYQTVLPEKSGEIIAMLTSRPADYIIFTSPSTVANLATLLETDNLSKWFPQTRVACIGPVTAESAQVHGLQVHVQPEEHTSKGLVKALIEDSRK